MINQPTVASRTAHILNPRTVLTGLIGLILVATIGLLVLSLAATDMFTVGVCAVGFLCFVALLVAHLRGWQYSAQTAILAAVLFTIVGNGPAITTRQLSFTVLIPAVLAAMFLPWYWTVASFVICLVGIGLQSSFTGPLFGPDSILLALIVVAGAAAAGAFGRSAQQAAEVRADLLAKEKARVEEQSTELVSANELMEVQLNQQQQLLDLVATLETPAIQIADGVLLVALVGHIDTRRAQNLTEKLLDIVHTQRTRYVILDVAGVSLIDTAVAHAILSTTRAIRLLGCNVIMSGISAEVAVLLTRIGIDLGEVQTVRSPQAALATITEMHAKS